MCHVVNITPRRKSFRNYVLVQPVHNFLFLWNPKFHYCFHKVPPTIRIIGKVNSVHTIRSHLFKINFNIMLLSKFRSIILYPVIVSGFTMHVLTYYIYPTTFSTYINLCSLIRVKSISVHRPSVSLRAVYIFQVSFPSRFFFAYLPSQFTIDSHLYM